MNTVVLSDMHLSDAEPADPTRPLWKAFKRREHFVDHEFATLLQHIRDTADGPIELILNGDILDFDSVTALPADGMMPMTWLERLRGLSAEEAKSRFKLARILDDHEEWLQALRELANAGHNVVFVIGNHDMELHWPSVQQDLLARLDVPPERVRFCEWFYMSNGDTLIEHGNQYDEYCLSQNPINPLVHKGSRVFVRLPFGNLAARIMLNGMGFMNPHVDASFIKSSLWEYVLFYYRYVARVQPLLAFTWFWSAGMTLIESLAQGLLPAMRDPLTLPARVEGIATRAQSTPTVVWSLRELHAHPAIFKPFKILRELWLDRALLFAVIVIFSFWMFSTLNVMVNISIWWWVGMLLLLFPLLILYGRSISSDLDGTLQQTLREMPTAARIAGVQRVIHGHTHKARHERIDGIEYVNTGTWSPAFHDVACTQPYGHKCFAWLRPDASGERVVGLFEWTEAGVQPYRAGQAAPPAIAPEHGRTVEAKG